MQIQPTFFACTRAAAALPAVPVRKRTEHPIACLHTGLSGTVPMTVGRETSVEFITDREIYERVLLAEVPRAEKFVWIATADVKDAYVHRGKRMVPFLQTLAELADAGVQLRLLHAKEPGPAFREDFDKYPSLFTGLECILCPRVHFKSVVVDGRWAYMGSANLTGAGMGAKGVNRRNFENGIVTSDPEWVDALMTQFDSVWMGSRCGACDRKDYCASYQDLVGGDQ